MLDLVSDDRVKKTSAAKNHNRKVEFKLAKQLYDTKGLEGKWRYQLYELQREQDSLKKEYERLKFLSIRSSKDFDRKYGAIHHAEPNLRHRRLDDHRKHCPALAAKMAEPGKDYFGYHSAPGSHRIEDKTLNELEKELEDYFHKPEHLLREQQARKHLKHQKEENESVQEKVNKWKTQNSSRRRFSINEPPNLRHLAFLRDELIDKTSDNKNTDPNLPDEKKKPETRPKTVAVVEKRSIDGKKAHTDEKSPSNCHPSADTTKEPLSAKDVVDDFDLYAPDGRLRMALRMPDVDAAYEEAKKARYVRTKFKREFERQISNSDIFKKLHNKSE